MLFFREIWIEDCFELDANVAPITAVVVIGNVIDCVVVVVVVAAAAAATGHRIVDSVVRESVW